MSQEQPKPYEPSEEEIKKAEEMVTEEQDVMNEEKEVILRNEKSQNPHTPEKRAKYKHFMYLRKIIAREGIKEGGVREGIHYGSKVDISYKDNRPPTKGVIFNDFGIASFDVINSKGDLEVINTEEISNIKKSSNL